MEYGKELISENALEQVKQYFPLRYSSRFHVYEIGLCFVLFLEKLSAHIEQYR